MILGTTGRMTAGDLVIVLAVRPRCFPDTKQSPKRPKTSELFSELGKRL